MVIDDDDEKKKRLRQRKKINAKIMETQYAKLLFFDQFWTKGERLEKIRFAYFQLLCFVFSPVQRVVNSFENEVKQCSGNQPDKQCIAVLEFRAGYQHFLQKKKIKK